MSSNALATFASAPDATAIEQVLIGGDLARLTPPQRVSYYKAVCESLGLNPLTKPFDYINLNGKLTLYAKRDCADQLRKIHNVSITKLERELSDGLLTVTAYAQNGTGRTDTAIGAVVLDGLKGEAKANAVMKAETKAKRRVTLSICGLGWTDETETESIPMAKPVTVDTATGEIVGESAPAESTPAPDGFDAWVVKMTAAAREGTQYFREQWGTQQDRPFREFTFKHRKDLVDNWKAQAATADEARRAA